MKNIIVALCLCLIILLPLTLRADVFGEIIIAHPVKARELWITHLNVGGTTHQIYEHEPEPNFRILDVVTQKEGEYIAFLARSGDEAAGLHSNNIYILDKYQRGEKALNITQNRFGSIPERDFDISKKGDIVFMCDRPPVGVTNGVYLIPHAEFQETEPRATLLAENAHDPVWLPDGETIAFVEENNINIFTVATREKISLDVNGYLPTVSPDGRYIAAAQTFGGVVFEIRIYSLSTQRLIDSKRLIRNSVFIDFKWSPQGDDLVFTTLFGRKHYVMPFDQRSFSLGDQKEFLEQDIFGYHITLYDWTHVGAYPVEPTARFTTLWGKLKK